MKTFNIQTEQKACCDSDVSNTPTEGLVNILPAMNHPGQETDEPCCGPAAGPPSSSLEQPGYQLWHFVEKFKHTAAGPVPQIKTGLEKQDHWQTVKARWAVGRMEYKIAPGLYCTGDPGPEAPVLVTANFKLTFDTLRKELEGLDAWILVLDTRGINVWCAAGKGTFSTDEVVQRVKQAALDKVVNHKKLILPQLSATAVSGRHVKKNCGFEVVWGPVRANDIRKFLTAGMKCDAAMRRVTFTLYERIVLIPVELMELRKPTPWVLLAIFILSGIGLKVFSPGDAWLRGIQAVLAYGAGIAAGAVIVPTLLPWLPGTAFAAKGAATGIAAGLMTVGILWSRISTLEAAALMLFSVAASSYVAMNFTGATPYTSPTGVETEMRKAIPIQAAAVLIATVAWVGAAFG
jgi:CO dehydrogenase/acetyl-CoA synthase delta subunit